MGIEDEHVVSRFLPKPMHPRNTAYATEMKENTMLMLQSRASDICRLNFYSDILTTHKIAHTIHFTC